MMVTNFQCNRNKQIAREDIAHQTPDIHPMLFWCWPTVFDVDPTALGECLVFAGLGGPAVASSGAGLPRADGLVDAGIWQLGPLPRIPRRNTFSFGKCISCHLLFWLSSLCSCHPCCSGLPATAARGTRGWSSKKDNSRRTDSSIMVMPANRKKHNSRCHNVVQVADY